MKTKILEKCKTKLLKLKLLKTKTYKSEKKINYLLIKHMETRLKKIMQVIYRFHLANKKILFIGTPFKLNNQIKQLLKGERHNFIPETVWMHGILTNSKSSFKYLIKQHATNKDNISRFLFRLKSKFDLTVVLNESSNLAVLQETSLKRMPIISLNTKNSLTGFGLSTYKALGDYKFTNKTIRHNFFFLLLASVLKKAKQSKSRKKMKNFFENNTNVFKKQK